jgi:hypothetical protein
MTVYDRQTGRSGNREEPLVTYDKATVAYVPTRLAALNEKYHWRAVLLTGYVFAALASLGLSGVPVDREQVVLVIMGGLALSCIGRPVREMARIAFDWLPFTIALAVYDLARGLARVIGRPIAYTWQINIDKFLFLGHVPAEVLQQHFYSLYHIRWYDVVGSLIYMSYFIVPFVVAGTLWRRDWPAWRAFATRFVVIAFVSAFWFAIQPTAPPWAAARDHNLLHLELQDGKPKSARGLEAIGLHQATKLVDKGRASSNDYAAIPSLHTGFSVLVAITLWPRLKKKWLKYLVASYPVAMVVTLIYNGEHYFVDALIGALVVVLVSWAELATRSRRQAYWERMAAAHWPKLAAHLAPPGAEERRREQIAHMAMAAAAMEADES